MEIPSPEQMLGAGSRGDSNAEAGKPSSTNTCRVSRTVTSPREEKHDVNAERSVTIKRQKKKMMDKKENLNCLPYYVHYLIPLLVAKRKKKKSSSHQLFMTLAGQHPLTDLFSTQILTLEKSFGVVAGYGVLGMAFTTVHLIPFPSLPVASLL